MLRQYGTTRELEIWGLVDGELVNGVIDQLSYECPDSELEATAANFYEDVEASKAALPEHQMSLSDFLLSSSQGGRRLEDLSQTEQMHNEQAPVQAVSPAVYDLARVYMTDVKTRASRSIPTVKSTSFRPTSLQLQLYYHMLNRMITSDDVTMELLAARYDLDPERPFTEAFVSEVGGLNDEFFDTLSSQEFDLNDPPTPEDVRKISHSSGSASSSPVPASQDSTSILMTHGNLFKLWSYMKEQLRVTFIPSIPETESIAPSIPSHTQPATLEEYPTLISPVLTARFLSSAPTDDLKPKLLGSRSFLFDPNDMSSYITTQMEWWRGQRDPIGVNISDAWKCRICDFRDECTWRAEQEWAFARRNQGRRAGASTGI
jgi:exonuclease V